MGLRLSVAKTRVVHIDEGFDFLGWHIQRRDRSGRAGKKAIYTYPSKKALASVVGKLRSLTRRAKHRTFADLLGRLNPVLRGWCNYFRHGVSSRTFGHVDYLAFWRVFGWLRKRHPKLNLHTLVRRFMPGWHVRAGGLRCLSSPLNRSCACESIAMAGRVAGVRGWAGVPSRRAGSAALGVAGAA